MHAGHTHTWCIPRIMDGQFLWFIVFCFHLWIKYTSFNVWARYFVWNFKWYLWNSTQNVLAIHWKIPFLNNVEFLRALRSKTSQTFLKFPTSVDYIHIQYIPRNMHTVFALLCFVVVIHWLIFPHPSGLLHWHCGNLTIATVPAKQPWWIWINTSCEFIMNDCITTTKQSTTKPCAYFLGYTVL